MESASGLTVVPGRNDFITSSGTTVLNDTEQQAQHIIRKSYSPKLMNDFNGAGDIIFNISLNAQIDTVSTQMAKEYEYFSFEDLTLYMQATSPFGVSSGAMQICHMTDPNNTTFSEDGVANLEKVIRQQGSVIARPRESGILPCPTAGELFTLSVTGQDRFSSFGNIVAVVREPPAAGDQVTWACTLTGKINFFRTCVSSASGETSIRLKQDMIVRLVDEGVEIAMVNPWVRTCIAQDFVFGGDIYLGHIAAFFDGVAIVKAPFIDDDEADVKLAVLLSCSFFTANFTRVLF